MRINNRMNMQLGTKWFTFYTKIRPWIVCFFTLGSINDFIQHSSVYLTNLGLMVSFMESILQSILCFMVLRKSNGNYDDFVHFVNKVLVFETCGTALQSGLQQYIKLNFAGAIIVTGLVGLISYFIWYRPNITYFQKRLLLHESEAVSPIFESVSPIDTEKFFSDSHKIRFCRKCGEELEYNSRFCRKCGTEIIKE